MSTKKMIALAIAAGLVLAGCGDKSEPTVTTKAPTIAEVAAKMQVSTSEPTPTMATTPEADINFTQLGARCLAAQGDEDVCFEMLSTCRDAMDVHQRGCVTGLKRCLSTVADQRRCFKSGGSKPARKLKPQPTPTPKPQTIKACLHDEGFATDVDGDSPTMITVTSGNGTAMILLEQLPTAADAKAAMGFIDEIDDETRARAEEDGWSPDSGQEIINEAVGRYLITYMYAEDSERKTVHNCVKAFEEGN